ncbi:hypothetical protein KR222_011296 [Zaprionus bogoriensis]|nr:hypothetical protein KR222_011296 [Zaprionus bogoriensis]
MRRQTVNLLELLLLLLAATTIGTTTSAETSSSSKLDTLSLALAQVLQQSEMSECSTLYVHVQYSALSARPRLLELLSRLLETLPPAAQCVQLAEQRAMSYKPFQHAVLLLVEDLAALRRVYGGLSATSNLSYTLVYMLQPQPEAAAMQHFWQRSVLNVALLTDHQLLQVQLLSYFPFGPQSTTTPEDCQLIRASVVNRFDPVAARWQRTTHFPPKLGNFHGCSLVCATWPDMPYLVQRAEGSFVGIEGALLQFMADNLNFSVGLYWLNQSQVRDTFNESGWIFEQIFDVADYALGGFHYKPSDSNAAWEVPYSQSMYYFMSHIMLVTNLPSAYSAYEKLAFPFHPHLWQAIGAVLALSCLAIWLLRRCWRPFPQHPYYHLLVLTMGGNLLAAALPRRLSLRLLLVTWLSWSLVLRCAYQSGMYQLLRQDTQRNPPQTIAEVLAQRYTIQLVDGNADRWLASLPELREQPLRHLAASELQSFGALAASSGTAQRLAIITPYEYFGYFRKVHAMSRRLHLVRERIFTQQLAFNVRRRSYLVGVLNKQIMLAHSHGFLEHWTRQYVSALDERDESIARIAAVPYDTLDGLQPEGPLESMGYDEPPVKLRVLSLTQLAALFWLTLWAQLGAVLVFGLELLLAHCSSRTWRRRSRRIHSN